MFHFILIYQKNVGARRQGGNESTLPQTFRSDRLHGYRNPVQNVTMLSTKIYQTSEHQSTSLIKIIQDTNLSQNHEQMSTSYQTIVLTSEGKSRTSKNDIEITYSGLSFSYNIQSYKLIDVASRSYYNLHVRKTDLRGARLQMLWVKFCESIACIFAYILMILSNVCILLGHRNYLRGKISNRFMRKRMLTFLQRYQVHNKLNL